MGMSDSAGAVRGRAVRSRARGTGATLAITVLLGLALAACASGAGDGVEVSAGSEPTGDDSLGRGDELPSPGSPQAVPSPAEDAAPRPSPGGATDLVVEVTDASGASTAYTLSCEPAAGSHPDPEAACAALAAAADSTGGDPFRVTPPGTMCTQEYGGPETARVEGSFRGQPVAASLSLRDGCEIDRWTRLGELLSPFATVGETGVTS